MDTFDRKTLDRYFIEITGPNIEITAMLTVISPSSPVIK